MQTLPFSESDILSNVYTNYTKDCGGEGDVYMNNTLTSYQKEQCRNRQLATWSAEYIQKASAPPQNLHDLAEHYQREWQTSVHLGIGILGLLFGLRVIGSL